MGNKPTKEELSEENLTTISYLSKIDLFKEEKQKRLAQVASVLKLCTFEEGEVLIKQGDESDYMYIIADGEVLFTHADPATGRQRKISRAAAGTTFGEFGLVYNVRRTAAAVAATPKLVVLRLDREVYEQVKDTKFMKPLSQKVKEVCSQLMKSGLRKLPVLKSFEESDLDEICDLFNFEVVQAGKTLIREGDPPDRFYLVFNGELVVTKIDQDTLPYEIARLTTGNSFGERGLLNRSPTEASVTAITNCELFSLKVEDFKEFLESMPEEIREELKRSSYGFLLRDSVEIFGTLSATNLNLLGMLSQWHEYGKGHELIKEGTVNNKFLFVIIKGQVEIKRKGKKLRVADNGYLGEVSMFTDKPTSSTCVVFSHSLQVLKIPLKDFQKLIKQERAVYSEIALKVLGKDAQLQTVLEHPKSRMAFFTHCKKEFSEESLEFLGQVVKLEQLKFKSLDPEIEEALGLDSGALQKSKDRMLKDRAMQIYYEFVEKGSPHEINVSHIRKDEIKERVEKEDFDFDMYAGAKSDVLNLIEQDTFSRFKDSQEFEAVLKELGMYQLPA